MADKQEAYAIRRIEAEGGEVRPTRNGYHFSLHGEVGFASVVEELLAIFTRTKDKPVTVERSHHINNRERDILWMRKENNIT